VVLATHSEHLLPLADRVVVLAEGKGVVGVGPAAQLRAQGLLGEAKLQQRRQSSEDGGVVEVRGGADTGTHMLSNTMTVTR
jgi:ABC-type molybdate transport system ATPase subunit